MTFTEFFFLGMKRILPALKSRKSFGSNVLNLGSGNSPIDGAINLDWPEWKASGGISMMANSSVDVIHAYHFLEHLSGENAIKILRECERVLVPGGIMNICVPHRLSQLAYEDLDHKSFWCEETLKNLFKSTGYDKNRETPWRLDVHFCLIAGLNERNLALFIQLIKI